MLDVATRTLDKLKEMAPELANELTPRFKEILSGLLALPWMVKMAFPSINAEAAYVG